jgi:hypothetical protein
MMRGWQEGNGGKGRGKRNEPSDDELQLVPSSQLKSGVEEAEVQRFQDVL